MQILHEYIMLNNFLEYFNQNLKGHLIIKFLHSELYI